MKLIPFVFLICASLHAAITPTSGSFSYAVSNTTAVAATSPNIACTETINNGNTGIATVICFPGTVTTNGTNTTSINPSTGTAYNLPQDTGFTVNVKIPPMVITLNFATGLNTVTWNGQTLYSATLSGTGLTNAAAVLNGPEAQMRDTEEWYLINVAKVVSGTQNDVW